MLRSGKHNMVHFFFEKMRRNGLPPKSLTYKVLVSAFWEEGMVNDAIEAVRDMESRGVIGTASVYYELACCLCNKGRWREATTYIAKLKATSPKKPLEVAYTGMIKSCMEGGHMQDCLSVFQSMKDYCTPNIGTINIMLKVYGRSDMFTEAKELFESVKVPQESSSLTTNEHPIISPDAYSYSEMLEVCAASEQWGYFEYVYKEMILYGFRADQQKHTGLLVRASKAGKCHLLEHAFETLLEEGEIPQAAHFAELICVKIASCEYDRAVRLLNGMAHASILFTEERWVGLVQENSGRISREVLRDFSTFLNTNSTIEDATISNLLKVLSVLCSKDEETHFISSNSIANGYMVSCKDANSGPVAKFPRSSHDHSRNMEYEMCSNLADRRIPASRSKSVIEKDTDTDIIASPFGGIDDDYIYEEEEEEDDTVRHDSVSGDDQLKTHGAEKHFGGACRGVTSNKTEGPYLPSVDEILSFWKESRLKDNSTHKDQLTASEGFASSSDVMAP